MLKNKESLPFSCFASLPSLRHLLIKLPLDLRGSFSVVQAAGMTGKLTQLLLIFVVVVFFFFASFSYNFVFAHTFN